MPELEGLSINLEKSSVKKQISRKLLTDISKTNFESQRSISYGGQTIDKGDLDSLLFTRKLLETVLDTKKKREDKNEKLLKKRNS
jgi:hypothetical protein